MSSTNAFAALANQEAPKATISVTETEEIASEKHAFDALSKKSAYLRISEQPYPEGYPQSRVQLFAISSNNAKYAYATSTGNLCTGSIQELQDAITGIAQTISFTSSKSKQSATKATHLCFTAKALYIATQTSLECLTHDLEQISSTALASSISQLVPNPAEEAIAYICADGKLFVNNKQIAETCTSIAWSQRGKQIIAGHADGVLRQYTPTGELKASLHPPAQGLGKVMAVAWLENNLFCITYSNDDDELEVYLLRRTPKSDELNYTKLINPSLSFGDTSHPPYYSLFGLSKTLVMTASTTSADVGLISVPQSASLSFPSTTLMRFSDERSAEVSIIGLAVQTQGEGKILWIADNDGGLSAWTIIDQENVLVETAPSANTAASTAQSPFASAVQSQANQAASPFAAPAQPTSGPSPFSAFNNTGPAAPSPFANPALATSVTPTFGATQGLKTPAFGSPSGFGGATQAQGSAFSGWGSGSAFETPAGTQSSFANLAAPATAQSMSAPSTPALGSSAFGSSGGGAFAGFPRSVSATQVTQATKAPSKLSYEMIDSDDEGIKEDKLANLDAQEPESVSSSNVLSMGDLDVGKKPMPTPQDGKSITSGFGKPGGFSFPSAKEGGFGFNLTAAEDKKLELAAPKPAPTAFTFGSTAAPSQADGSAFENGKSNIPSSAFGSAQKTASSPFDLGGSMTGFGFGQKSSDTSAIQLPKMPAPAPAPPVEDDAPLPPSPETVAAEPSEDAPLPPDPSSVKTPLPDVKSAFGQQQKAPEEDIEPSRNSFSITQVEAEIAQSTAAVHDEVKHLPPLKFDAAAVDETKVEDLDDFAKFSEEEADEEDYSDVEQESAAVTASDEEERSDEEDEEEDDYPEADEESDATQSEEEYEPQGSAFGMKAPAFQLPSSASSNQRASPFALPSESGKSRPASAFSSTAPAFDFRTAMSHAASHSASPSAAAPAVSQQSDQEIVASSDSKKPEAFAFKAPKFDFKQASASTKSNTSDAGIDGGKSELTTPSLKSTTQPLNVPVFKPQGEASEERNHAIVSESKPKQSAWIETTGSEIGDTRASTPIDSAPRFDFSQGKSESPAPSLDARKLQTLVKESKFKAVTSNSGADIQPEKATDTAAQAAESKMKTREPGPVPTDPTPLTLGPFETTAQPIQSTSQDPDEIARQLDVVWQQVGNDFALIEKNLNTIKNYIDASHSEEQSLHQAGNINADAASLLSDAKAISVRASKATDALATVRSGLVKLEAQHVKISRVVRQRTDASMTAQMQLSGLGPEHANHQRQLRQHLAGVEKSLDALQSQLSLLRTRLSGLDASPARALADTAPSPENIAVAVGNVARMADTKAADVERLQRAFVESSSAGGSRLGTGNSSSILRTPIHADGFPVDMQRSSSRTYGRNHQRGSGRQPSRNGTPNASMNMSHRAHASLDASMLRSSVLGRSTGYPVHRFVGERKRTLFATLARQLEDRGVVKTVAP